MVLRIEKRKEWLVLFYQKKNVSNDLDILVVLDIVVEDFELRNNVQHFLSYFEVAICSVEGLFLAP